ncbi:unnamed protein product, partial [Didymodactylos carnosus]
MSNSTSTPPDPSDTTAALRPDDIDQQELANFDMNHDDPDPQQMLLSSVDNLHVPAAIPAASSTPFRQPAVYLQQSRPDTHTTPLNKRKNANDTNESEENGRNNYRYHKKVYIPTDKQSNGANNAQNIRENQSTTTSNNYDQFNRQQQQLQNNSPLQRRYPFQPRQTYYPTYQNNYSGNNMRYQQRNYEPNNYRSQNNENNEITRQAERFAETRYPFSPYVLHFTSTVNEKEVIKQLVKHMKDTDNFDLQIAAYRKSQVNCPDNEYNILLFVATTESFAYLLNADKGLPQLDNKTYQLKTPSIPPQLSAVIQNVGFDIDIDEFSENVKELYPEIVNLVRLKNRTQRDLKLVKAEFNSVTARNAVLQAKDMTVNYMRFQVVEYLALARVLVCSR